MATQSLRDGLAAIGALKSEDAPVRLPSSMHSAPVSLREALRAMTSPRLEQWQLLGRTEFPNKTWTEEAQGLTTDGMFWFVSSNNSEKRAVWKFDSNFLPRGMALLDIAAIVGEFGPSGLPGLHIGDIDFFQGVIYAPIETYLLVARFSPEPRFIDVRPLRHGRKLKVKQTHMPWCAINPWNGWLYSSDFDSVDRVYAYDPGNDFTLCDVLMLDGPPVNHVQGGAFSANGRLYLTSDDTGDVRCYSALNGAFLGTRSIPYDPSTLEAEEVEGIALAWDGVHVHKSQSATVNVIVLDNDVNKDDVFLVRYRVPQAATL